MRKIKTEFILNPDLTEMGYPVGRYIISCKPIIQEMIKTFLGIKAFKNKDINLICQGSSGAIIATIFSLGIPNTNRIIHIKKEGESSHNADCYLGSGEAFINVIVDDFICSGATLNRIYKTLKSHNDGKIVIDCICVSGVGDTTKPRGDMAKTYLDFKPRYFVCQKEKHD
jgi:adenine/guanine phosphoribosyltransferase-like PRPP-binding protein